MKIRQTPNGAGIRKAFFDLNSFDLMSERLVLLHQAGTLAKNESL